MGSVTRHICTIEQLSDALNLCDRGMLQERRRARIAAPLCFHCNVSRVFRNMYSVAIPRPVSTGSFAAQLLCNTGACSIGGGWREEKEEGTGGDKLTTSADDCLLCAISGLRQMKGHKEETPTAACGGCHDQVMVVDDDGLPTLPQKGGLGEEREAVGEWELPC